MLEHAFAGIRVLDITTFIAGPYAGSLLANLGAHVTKIEPFTGDASRTLIGGWQTWNKGKHGLALDLAREEGRRALHRMAAQADIFLENLRTGVLPKLKADYQSIRALNPRIIYCSISAYGRTGPLSSKPGFDPLCQARTGIMRAQGGDGAPVFHRIALCDYATAGLTAWALALALYHRQRTGQGQYIEASLLNSGLALQAANFFDYRGKQPQPRVDHPSGVPLGADATHRYYQTRDSWVFIGVRSALEWTALCHVIGQEALARDRRFSPRVNRLRHQAELTSILEQAFPQRTTAEWMEELAEHGVPAAPVHYSHLMFADPQITHNDLLARFQSADVGRTTQLANPVKLGATPGKEWGPAPAIGQHSEQVLASYGFSPAEVAELEAKDVVRQREA